MDPRVVILEQKVPVVLICEVDDCKLDFGFFLKVKFFLKSS